MAQYDYSPDDDPADRASPVKLTSAPITPHTSPGRGRGSANFLDDIADDLGVWIDETANSVALAFAPGRAPFSANITEDQKLEYYKSRLFNPDGSPNAQGREAEFQRLGVQGFSQVYRALTARWPELRVPAPPPIEVPEEWPGAPAGPPQGPPGPAPGPQGPPPGPPGGPPGSPVGAPGAPLPPGPPRPPMMPPAPVRR